MDGKIYQILKCVILAKTAYFKPNWTPEGCQNYLAKLKCTETRTLFVMVLLFLWATWECFGKKQRRYKALTFVKRDSISIPPFNIKVGSLLSYSVGWCKSITRAFWPQKVYNHFYGNNHNFFGKADKRTLMKKSLGTTWTAKPVCFDAHPFTMRGRNGRMVFHSKNFPT